MAHALRPDAALFPSQGSSVEITELGLSDMEAAHPALSDQPSLPAFGTGIEFRPRPKSEPRAVQSSAASAAHAPGSAAAGGGSGSSGGALSGSAGGGALGSHLQGDEAALQEGGDAMDLGSPTEAPPAAAAVSQAEGAPVVLPPRQRNYRKAVAK